MVYLSVLITALLAGVVQGVTGFGGGIITMLIFPHFFTIPIGAGKGPHIHEILELLGKEEALKRIDKGLEVLA